jgi:hypothetical protein
MMVLDDEERERGFFLDDDLKPLSLNTSTLNLIVLLLFK